MATKIVHAKRKPGGYTPPWFARLPLAAQRKINANNARHWRWLGREYFGLNARHHRAFLMARKDMLNAIDTVWDLFRFTGISKRRVAAYEKRLEDLYREISEATAPAKLGARPRPGSHAAAAARRGKS